MKLLRYFTPDMMFEDIYAVSAAFLLSIGKRGVIFDIDNTIAPYEVERPTEKMKEYLRGLSGAGIKVALLSNNKKDRARIFNEELGFFFISDASKPSPKGVISCMKHLELTPESTVVIGDQIFTDCLAARRAEVGCFLVKPIKDKKTLFFRAKRFLERPFIKHFKKLKRKERDSSRNI